MSAEERQNRIVKLVDEYGSIRVSDLSRRFQVTSETIRRDLNHLARRGELRRNWGGAVKPDHLSIRRDIAREDQNIRYKREIALAAWRFIHPGDHILLDGSEMARLMAGYAPNVPMLVLTNSVRVAMELAGRDRITVICIGGLMHASSCSIMGSMAEETLAAFHVQKAFLSAAGVHVNQGISEVSELHALCTRRMIAIAEERYLLADQDKLNVYGFVKICSLDAVDHIITDSRADPDRIAMLQRHAGKVILADGTAPYG